MRQTSTLRRASWVGLSLLVLNTGCTHNYYYGTSSECPPIGQTVTGQLGQVCDVPGGTTNTSGAAPVVVSQANPGGSVVLAPNPRRVVISQPTYNPTLSNRFRWQRPQPETLSRYDGALEESTNR